MGYRDRERLIQECCNGMYSRREWVVASLTVGQGFESLRVAVIPTVHQHLSQVEHVIVRRGFCRQVAGQRRYILTLRFRLVRRVVIVTVKSTAHGTQSSTALMKSQEMGQSPNVLCGFQFPEDINLLTCCLTISHGLNHKNDQEGLWQRTKRHFLQWISLTEGGKKNITHLGTKCVFF